MINGPVFSIIIPVYNVEDYLDKCVNSVLNQTYPNIEIILVNDGSPDNCPALCDIYAQKDKRVKVIHKENGGLSDARNAGITLAKGEYIIFVDSDDYIALDTCERLLPYTKHSCDIIIGDGESTVKNLIHKYNGSTVIYNGKEYLKTVLKDSWMPMMAVLYVYNRTFLMKNHLLFKYGIMHEDEHFTPRAFLLADKVINSGICFYHYVIREGSITTRKDLRKNAVDLYETCLELKEIYVELVDCELKQMLIDLLVMKYLSLFQAGKLYQYGKSYIHKKFVWENACFFKTKVKAILFCISPRFYWQINNLLKKLLKR